MASSDARPELAKTGVAGLDEVLHGGLPRSHLYLLQGQPGTGKTTLALQFLTAGAEGGERLLYITLSQTKAELEGIAASHGLDLGRVTVAELSPAELAQRAAEAQTVLRTADLELGETIKAIEALVERERPDRLVFDSLLEIQLLSNTELRYRREFLDLKDYLVRRDVTVLLVDTLERDGEGQHGMAALAHGVLRLDWKLPDYGIAHRRLAVAKLRGQAFTEGFHDMTITTGGVEVYPRLVPDAAPAAPTGVQIESGVPELDELLNGGLEAGTACLVTGYSGAGKSTLATAYARAAAVRGMRAAYLLFEERPEIFLRRARELGMDLRDEAVGDRVAVLAFDPAEVSPGAMFQAVQRAVDGGAKVVVIDSLTGFLAALPGGRAVMSQFRALLGYLGRRNVLTLLVLSQHGLLGLHAATDVDFSYVADTIILLRQYEAGNAIRRTVAVVKKRYGPHETEVRELRITSQGVVVRAIGADVDVARQPLLGSGGGTDPVA